MRWIILFAPVSWHEGWMKLSKGSLKGFMVAWMTVFPLKDGRFPVQMVPST